MSQEILSGQAILVIENSQARNPDLQATKSARAGCVYLFFWEGGSAFSEDGPGTLKSQLQWEAGSNIGVPEKSLDWAAWELAKRPEECLGLGFDCGV